MFAPCTYTSADGSYFDLSPLTKYNAAQDYVMADAAGNSYIMNVRKSPRCSTQSIILKYFRSTEISVFISRFTHQSRSQVCGDAMVVPTACVDLEKIVPAPAYQVAGNPFHCLMHLFVLCSNNVLRIFSEAVYRSLREMIATGSVN